MTAAVVPESGAETETDGEVVVYPLPFEIMSTVVSLPPVISPLTEASTPQDSSAEAIVIVGGSV